MILQPVIGGGQTPRSVRESVYLTGTYDGVNCLFYLPEAAVHDPPRRRIKVYHGGRRLQPVEYIVQESFPGSGYDMIQLIFAPQPMSRLFADYYVAP